jgi:hypothetical protein
MPEWLPKAADWTGLKTVIKVEKSVEFTGEGDQPAEETRYYISSLNLALGAILKAAAMHWSVETCIFNYLYYLEPSILNAL